MSRKSKLPRTVLITGLLALALAVSARLALLGVGWWIDFGEAPAKSDVMVVLAGSFARPAYAAELFAQGYAPEVWLSRPRRPSSLVELDKLDVHLPREEEINREILMKRGVPKDRIRFYGGIVNSTADEASELRRDFPPKGKKILLVTSRFHARRSRLIFRTILPEADLRVVSTPYEDFDRRWWKSKELLQNGIGEIVKVIYFLCGGRMR